MKKLFVILLGLYLPIVADAVPATVSYIVDGDTFAARVMLDEDIKITVRVRLINVDTPEISGECDSEIRMAYQARDRLAELIPVNSIIELVNIKDDKYLGRIDANVLDKSGRDVGAVLIKEKLGRPYSGGKRVSWCTATDLGAPQNDVPAKKLNDLTIMLM